MGRHSLSVSPAVRINSKCAVGIAWQVQFWISIPRSVSNGQTRALDCMAGLVASRCLHAARQVSQTPFGFVFLTEETGLTVSRTLRYLTRVCEVSMYLRLRFSELIYSDKSCKLMQRETFPWAC